MLGCRFFPFITLNISCHSLLACRVSVEKSANNMMRIPLYVICHFFFVAFHFCQYLGVFLLGFILPGTLCASCTWFTISFSMLGKSASISRSVMPQLCGLVGKSCLTLVTPWTVACQAHLSMGFSRQKYWNGLPFPFQGIFLIQGSNPCLLLGRQILYN